MRSLTEQRRSPTAAGTGRPALFFKHSGIQRKCKKCEEQEQLQRQPLSGGKDPANQGRAASVPGSVSSEVTSSLQSSKGRGAPLPAETRDWMESRFGLDFSDVKIHTHSKAVQMSRQLAARAFVHGNNVYFNSGEYAPGTTDGKRLLAHELTHVVQQGTGRAKSIQRQSTGQDHPQDERPCTIHFRRGSTEFTDPNEFARCMRAVRSYLAAYPAGAIVISGFASEEGTRDYNMHLSQRRGQTVLQLLGSGGIDVRRITVRALGEDTTFPTREENRRVEIVTPAVARREIESVQPEQEPPATEPHQPTSSCTKSEFFRELLGIDQGLVPDIINCFCLAGGILDLYDTAPFLLPASPYIEGVDCVCNILVVLQHLYNIGADDAGCWSVGNVSAGEWLSLANLSAATYADCASLPAGAALGALLGGLSGGSGGTAVAPGPGTVGGAAGGGAMGAMLGDFILDIAAMALQNYITQGTPWPVNQCHSCVRLANKLNVAVDAASFCGPQRSTPQW